MSATITTISSGSIGNSYILDCNGEKLILECGVRWKDILRSLSFQLDNVVGCCTSHAHGDHIKSVPNALSYGLPVYAPPSVCDIYPKCKVVEHATRYRIEGFTIMPLKVPHGECECVSYYIELPDGQKGIFATDCETWPYNIKGLNFVMIEANYSEDVIVDRLCAGYDARSSYNTHMGLNETIKVLKRLNNPNLNKVILIHLSNSNSDVKMFKDRIFSETGIRCEIADAGMIFELKEDF